MAPLSMVSFLPLRLSALTLRAKHVAGELYRRCGRQALVLFVLAWMADYLRHVKRVQLHFGDRSRALGSTANKRAHLRLLSISRRCPALSQVYWPTWYAPHAALQFMLLGLKELRNRFLQRNPYTRETCRLRDGTQIALDWVLPASGIQSEALPVCVLLHGAFMDSQSVTMSDLARALAARGMPSVVMNRRGYGSMCVGSGDAVPRLSLFGFDEDLDDVLEVVGRRHPGRTAAIIGFSCGSGFAGRFVGKRPFLSAWDRAREEEDVGAGSTFASSSSATAQYADGRQVPQLLCSVAYDPGYDVSPEGAVKHMRPPFSWFLSFGMKYYYAFKHRSALRRKSGSWAQLVGDILNPRNGLVSTYRMARRLTGANDSNQFLDLQQPRLYDLEVPSLLINSRDDPICVWKMVEKSFDAIKGNPNLLLAELQRGAHGCKFDFWGLSNVAHEMIVQFVLGSYSEVLTTSPPTRAVEDSRQT